MCKALVTSHAQSHSILKIQENQVVHFLAKSHISEQANATYKAQGCSLCDRVNPWEVLRLLARIEGWQDQADPFKHEAGLAATGSSNETTELITTGHAARLTSSPTDQSLLSQAHQELSPVHPNQRTTVVSFH